MKKTFFANQLLLWYSVHKRDLPWRNHKNPYYIWLSEVLLQQTRVQQGLPYYEKFVEHYPSVEQLAAADEKDILRLWQGLGYYSRARNLHAAAKYIVNELQGTIPDTYAGLMKLKGVGNYTAAAIASFAFNENVAVLDGNVYRVLARVFGIHTDIASGTGGKEFAALAKKLLPQENSSEYNQAIMEFGALHCTPAQPKCPICPLQAECLSYKNNWQQILPVKINKLKKKFRYFNYIVFKYQGEFLMRERVKGDIWTGLYEFHLVERASLESPAELIDVFGTLSKDITATLVSKDYKHLLTHQTIFARFLVWDIGNEKSMLSLKRKFKLELFGQESIQKLPKPVLIIKFLDDYVFV